MSFLQRVGLVEIRRIAQWTYYKSNEAAISALAEIIGQKPMSITDWSCHPQRIKQVREGRGQ